MYIISLSYDFPAWIIYMNEVILSLLWDLDGAVTQYRINVGPASRTMVQHYQSIGQHLLFDLLWRNVILKQKRCWNKIFWKSLT